MNYMNMSEKQLENILDKGNKCKKTKKERGYAFAAKTSKHTAGRRRDKEAQKNFALKTAFEYK